MLFTVLAFISGFGVAFLLSSWSTKRLIKSGAVFFYKNKHLFELKEEIEEELKELLNEIRMERSALESLKMEAELLAERLESLIVKIESLKNRDIL
ncbi:MAG: hypothetical protein H5T91_00960 [Synergistetes bacterium]|nr:hypothetical protein [Synergistota bacterium]MDK2871622.1 hypothetical protein [bacterium]